MRVSREEGAQRAYENSLAAKWKRVRFKDNRLPETKSPMVAAFECWCGLPYDHDWPGKAEGAKHPSSIEGRPVPPKVADYEFRLALQKAGVCSVCRGYPKNPLGAAPGEARCYACDGTGEFPRPSTAELIRRGKAARAVLETQASGPGPVEDQADEDADDTADDAAGDEPHDADDKQDETED